MLLPIVLVGLIDIDSVRIIKDLHLHRTDALYHRNPHSVETVENDAFVNAGATRAQQVRDNNVRLPVWLRGLP